MPIQTGQPNNTVDFTPQQIQQFAYQYGDSIYLNARARKNDSDLDISQKFFYGWVEMWKRGSQVVTNRDPDYGKAWPVQFSQAPTAGDNSVMRYRLHASMWDTTTDSDFTFNAAQFDPRVTWQTGDGAIIPNGTIIAYPPLTEPLLGAPVTLLFTFFMGYVDPVTSAPVRDVIAKGQWIVYGNVASPIAQDGN